jgi:PncC family amidohydrolase
VTSGLLQNVFANAEDASIFFQGGITAYNLHQKCTHLFINPAYAVTCNCVSETVAAEMATGVRTSFKSDWGIAITGYASPVPEVNLVELYACYAISFNSEIVRQSTVTASAATPEKVQQFYASVLIGEFINCCHLTPLYQ